MRNKSVWFVITSLLFAFSAQADEGFEQWLSHFYTTAASQGITRSTYTNAFDGVHEPDMDVLKKAAFQPEYTLEIWEYLDGRINSYSLGKGMEMYKQYSPLLQKIENDFHVDGTVLLAIWSMETGYGEVLKKRERLHYIPQALATLAYGDAKRKKFGETQLIAALQILQKGTISKDQLVGSWAGAMGHTQFIPTSYLAYAYDFDGNGRADIWNSVPDALATSANLLGKNGWNLRRGWGCETTAPENGMNYVDQSKPLSEWIRLGFKLSADCGKVKDEDHLVLKMPAKNAGPAFLTGKNYSVVKKYNNSDAYALAALLLSDRISGLPQPVKKWERPANSVIFEEKIEIQQLLKSKGYYSGEPDGFFGNASKDALKRFQQEKGMEVTGLPTKTVLTALRGK